MAWTHDPAKTMAMPISTLAMEILSDFMAGRGGRVPVRGRGGAALVWAVCAGVPVGASASVGVLE